MTTSPRVIRRVRFVVLASAVMAVVFVSSFMIKSPAEASHPVLVEGNCDSPVPGTTLVAPGTCGDYDGDGRIGTAEDTDGADRIFGTINAALGPGTGAAAGTGVNHDGRVQIVTSGRFYEAVYIGANINGPGAPGIANPGNVTLEAAPGVSAVIDAMFQGDPGGGNATRQNGFGIAVVYLGTNRIVTLRNLVVRNFDVGIDISQSTNVVIDNCRVENNLNSGIRLGGPSRTVIVNSSVTATGYRIGGPVSTPTRAYGIEINPPAVVKIQNTTISHSSNVGIFHNLGPASSASLYKVSAYFSGTQNVFGSFTTCTDAAACQ